ncbi:phage tail protein (plasmid) [Pseudomonas fluorescens]|nr:phage tail protein [Pseudomonas fluorescens]
MPILVDPPVVLPSCPELCAQVDDAADMARKAVAGDPLRAVEYQRAADEAQAFKDAGYPDDAVPPMVAAWAISGRTAQQAANSILGEAAAYNNALVCIRTTRLGAKEQIRALMTDEKQEEAQALADATVAAILKAVEGIGNSAGAAQGELQ